MPTYQSQQSMPKDMQLVGMLSHQHLFKTNDYQLKETEDSFVFSIPKVALANHLNQKPKQNLKSDNSLISKDIQDKLDDFQLLLQDTQKTQVRSQLDIDNQIRNERDNWE